jgi:hypothetical protein
MSTDIILKIDPHFQRLIPPLTKDEFEQLEKNILSEGCRDPICVWNNIILDGHNRYAICKKYRLQFRVRSIDIKNRHDAISWICANQLGRRNITQETRKYLIGKRYHAEKQKCQLQNLHKKEKSPNPESWDLEKGVDNTSDSRTSVALGKEYQISHSTVESYGRYTRALDNLAKKAQEAVPHILAGDIKLSQENVKALAKLPSITVRKVLDDLEGKDKKERRNYLRNLNKSICSKQKTIKDMPDFDPDAEVSSLILTLPSWRDTMLRVIQALKTKPVTPAAKENLGKQLQTLIQPIAEIIQTTMKG